MQSLIVSIADAMAAECDAQSFRLLCHQSIAVASAHRRIDVSASSLMSRRANLRAMITYNTDGKASDPLDDYWQTRDANQ